MNVHVGVMVDPADGDLVLNVGFSCFVPGLINC